MKNNKPERPLFVPLKTEFFAAFLDGSKTTEFRQYGPRWNENTCRPGRRVVLSRGYGKHHRLGGVVVGFEKKWTASAAWLNCYGAPGWAACIEIELDSSTAENKNPG